MTLWLIRSGRQGAAEQRFLDEGRAYLTWKHDRDLRGVQSRDDVVTILSEEMEGAKPKKVLNHASQVFAFLKRIRVGDWVVMPSKLGPVIHFGKVTSDVRNHRDPTITGMHYRDVDWFATDVPRANFAQDLLHSFGAFMTICQIKRNDADARVRAMAANGWRESVPGGSGGGLRNVPDEEPEGDGEAFDLAQAARDQLARFLQAKFAGHEMQSLVAAVLKAMGYATHVPPKGPDGGVDILAGRGELGFGEPRICVQVKSSTGPVERVVLDQLIGTMQKVQADYGLLVSWGGFKSSVRKEEASQFFRVRLWDQDDIIDRLLEHYDRLSEDLRAEIPLTRMWALPPSEDLEN